MVAPEILLERFRQSYVVADNGCWIWQRGTSAGRYGSFYRQAKAHRWSYEQFVGPIPAGMVVCHRCDNGLCVNPEHLWLGTQRENVADMHAKGRARKYTGPRPWMNQWGDNNPSRKYIERMPRGERVNTAKLTADKVRLIREARAAGRSQLSLAKEYGISQPSIGLIVRRKTWKHVP